MNFRSLTRPPVLITLGVGAVGAVTLIVIRLFALSIMVALLAVLIVVLLVVIVLLVRQLRAARAAEEIETTITRQADRDIEKSVVGQQAELENLKAELLAAINALKASKLGQRHGKGALSILPWYMLIGPAGGGKGTLVQTAGLHFPVTQGRRAARGFRGVGGTRSLEWWITEEAVLLDMPGRLLSTAAFEDTDDWIAFLGMLKQQRKGRPINGVIVAVGLDQISGKSDKEVETVARRVRERIQELIHHLGVVFPVYVLFTRADQIAGFAETFGSLGSSDRRQPWGATIPVTRARDEAAEEIFDEEMDVLVGQISERRLARLADIVDPVQRARAFGFVGELAALRVPMRRFLGTLFEPDPVEESPIFRGFYLVSAAPEGRPVDRFLTAAANRLGVPLGNVAAPPALESGPWFLDGLLQRLVFPDAHLAAESSHAAARRARGRLTLFGGLAVLFAAIVLTLSMLSCAHNGLVQKTRKIAMDVDDTVSPNAPLIANVQSLEKLREPVQKLDELRTRKSVWHRISAYSGDQVRDPAVEFYIDRTLESLVDPGWRQIEGRLRTMTDTGTGEFHRYFHLFRAWRLLSEPVHLSPKDVSLVASEVAYALDNQVRAGAASAEEVERFPELVRRQIEFLARHPDEVAKRAPLHRGPLDRVLVARAAERIRTTWDSSQLYRLMVQSVARSSKPLGISDLVGENSMLEGAVTVPGPFTLEAFEKQIAPRIEDYNDLMQRDWVIEDAFQASGGAKPDLARDLRRLYAADYSKSWVDFLNGMSARRPPDLASANEMLKQAQKDDSPLFRSLRGVRDQTSLDVPGDSELARVPDDFQILEQFFAGEGDVRAGAKGFLRGVGEGAARIIGRGGKGNNLLDPNRSPKAKYQQLLREAQAKIDEAAQPGAPVSKLQELLAEAGDAPNPLRQLVAYSEQLAADVSGAGSQPTARVLAMLVTGAGGAGGEALRGALTQKWEMQVAAPFRKTLAGKYPFDPSGPDATVQDFTEFFKPGGTFWDFYKNELASYITEDGTPLGEQGKSVVSPALQACVRKAYDIREAFFGGGDKAGFNFDLRTTQPKIEGPVVTVYWVIFEVGSASSQYHMGAPHWEALAWPGPDAEAGARVRANAGGSTVEPIVGQGPWGLFRLMDQGHLGTSAAGNPTLNLRFATGTSALFFTYEFRPGSARHPFVPGFLRFSLPPVI